MRTAQLSFFVLAVAATVSVAAASGPAIVTAPLGLVNGVIEVEVDLGGTTGPATLYLDGVEACAPTAAEPTCRVDLGSGLHVHLLELVVGGTGGGVQRAERWLNRPGSEADLEIELAARPIGNVCGGRLNWFDVHGHQPVDLEADAAGERLAVSPDTRTFGYPCAEVGSTEVVTAGVVFGDGRRATAVALTADSGRSAGSEPQALVLEVTSSWADPCARAVDSVSGAVAGTERQGFEVAFVLDPTVKPAALVGLGGGGMTSAWELATTALSDADRLWYVRPSSSFERIDGFAGGRDIWLGNFIQFASTPAPAELRLADAVATAGLTAGAAPRRRAVVLVLGSGEAVDVSLFSVEQVRSYLAEIGVPLQVIRTDQVRSDGWPTGVDSSSLDGFADAVKGVRDRIDAQCVAWFPAHLEQRQIAALFPRGVAVAGRSEGAGGGEQVWRRAQTTGAASDSQPTAGEPFEGERVEVTAVEVLVRVHDGKGNPITDLEAGDLQVAENGNTVPVLQLEAINSLAETVAPSPETAATTAQAPLPGRKIVPVSIYVERRLSGVTDIQPAIEALQDQADWLTSLGPVDIVLAGSEIEPILVGATDAEVVRTTLAEVNSLPSHGHAIERIRKDYLRYIRVYPDRGQISQTDGSEPSSGGPSDSSTPDNQLRVRTMTIARTAIFEEDALLTRTMERMNDWALGLQSSGPRLLFLVGTGFDEDPIDFYLRFLEQKDPSLGTAARAEFIRYNQAARVGSVGRELAAAGWMVVPLATRIAGQQRSAAEFSGGETFQSFLGVGDSNYLRDVDFMLLDPLGSQQNLAGPSGGKVVIGGAGLEKLVSESAGWYRLTYQVARAPDGVLHEVAVTSDRSEISIESTGVVVSGTSEGRAAMRLRKMLDDPSAAGELTVKVDVGPGRTIDGNGVEASLIATVDLEPIAPLFSEDGARALRFSIGVRSGPGVPFVSHSLVTAAGAVGGMQFEAPIQWSGDDAELAVVVEDMGSGAWGGTVSSLSQ